MTWDQTSDGRREALIGTPAGSNITPEQASAAALRVAQCHPDLGDDERRDAIREVLLALGLLPDDGPILDADRRFHGWSPTRLSVVRD